MADEVSLRCLARAKGGDRLAVRHVVSEGGVNLGQRLMT